MKLDPYRCLLANLPVQQQAFTSKRNTWANRVNPLPNDLAVLFGANDETTISRSDLFWMAGASAIQRFVYAVILWGYPDGMRGNHFPNLVAKITRLEALLNGIRGDGNKIADWPKHWNHTFVQVDEESKIDGLGLSTYSKMLYFMHVRVNGKACLILDQVLIDLFSNGKFEEFVDLKGITYQSAPNLYPAYLEIMEREASRLGVSPDQLEMFLFMFGPILK